MELPYKSDGRGVLVVLVLCRNAVLVPVRMSSFKKSAVVAFVVLLTLDIR